MSDITLFHTFGELFKGYRRLNHYSQLDLASMMNVSLKTIERWEKGANSIKEDNLHDICDYTGIPFLVLVLLNNSYPVYYNIRNRQYYLSSEERYYNQTKLAEYSSIKKDQSIIVKTISNDTQLKDILDYDHDIYPIEIQIKKDVLKLASKIIPELNFTMHDKWGHFIGHLVTLPLRRECYHSLRCEEISEEKIALNNISDNSGLFILYIYSLFCSSIGCSLKVIRSVKNYSDISNQNSIIAGYSTTLQCNRFCENLGMSKIIENTNDYIKYKTEVIPTLWESNIEAIKKYGT